MSWEIVQGPGDGPRSTFRERRTVWWVLLAIGVLVVIAGVGLLIWPFIAAQWLLAVLFGAALIANGLGVLARSRSGLFTFGGIVLLAGGMLAILFSEFTAAALVTFTGVTLTAIGVFWLIVALGVGARVSQGLGVSGGFGGSALMVVPPVLLIAAGVLALLFPSWALAFVAVIAGLVTIAIGGSLIWAALALRRAIEL